jgi:hypothetical protein
MDLALVILFICGLFALIVFLILWAINRDKKRVALWTEIAVAQGGRWVDEQLAWNKRRRGIEVARPTEGTRPAVALFIDTYTVSTGKSSTTYTRGRVRYPLPAGPEFKVYKEGVFSSLGKALGTQDVELGGDPAFDALFMVKCDEPERVRQVWTPRAKELMRAHFADCRVDGTRKELRFLSLGTWTNRPRLERLIELLEELGRVDFYGHGVLAGLEQATFTAVQGQWHARELPRSTLTALGREVVFTPELGADGRTVALAGVVANERSLPSARITLGVGEAAEQLPAGMVDANTAPLIERLTGATLQITPRQLKLVLDHRPIDALDEAALRKVTTLLAQLATPSQQGAFR